jgi:general nucleoside transport system ATP-binding protein
MTPVVEMKGITKQFGDLTANDHVNFELRRGEIHALLGENGAGKTTLMRILYGLYKADSGSILVDGRLVDNHSPKEAIANGIGMVTQHFALVPPMSVAENVALGYGGGFVFKKAEIEKKVAEAAERFGVEVDPRAIVRHLSVGQRQRVEILKALYRNARVLILDEPTAVLVPQEVDILFEAINRLKKEGLSVVFISHKLYEVTKITDRVSVLRDGKLIGTVDAAGVTQNQLAQMMVGRESFGVRRHAEEKATVQKCLLEVKGLSANNEKGMPALKQITFRVDQGEILGLAGVSGNGQKELAETLCGLLKPTAGHMLVEGKDVTNYTPIELSRAGVGRVPEDRHEGVVGDMSVYENMALDHLAEFEHNGMLDRARMYKQAEELIARFQIKAKPRDRVRTLSGGNLQKVLLARMLSRNPKVIIVPQPTRGLDIGATDYIRQQLLEQRQRGAAVLLISEDLDEIMALSDRIAVIYEGQIAGILPASEATPERLGLLMGGGKSEEVQ